MKTNKLFTSFVNMGTRLIILASMLMTALISNVTPAFALPRVSTVSVAAQSGTLTFGTAGSATFLVTVNHVSGSGTLTANLSVTSGLPAGASASFAPASVIFTNTQTVQTSTLTITTTASAPVVTAQSFTVRAVRNTNSADFATGNGSLTINKAGQTIIFNPLPNKADTDPDFTVTATASSSLLVSFAAAGNCTVTGNLVHITSVGSCTITASQAGNGNYNAATSVPRTFAITAAGPVTSFDLYAVTGSTTLPGAVSATVWGYNTTNASVTQPGGPVLIVDQGATVSITLHNQLAESTSLLFQGQSMIPDTTGASSGGTKSYTFTASQPGTFLYEAGLKLNSQHQAAMGLYGVLVVRPTGFPSAAPGQAYGSASTAFDAEQVLVLSELDPALNGSATPASFDMRKYAPKYFLINGKAYPATTNIPVTAGNDLLLRYVNAGLQSHAMGLLGLTQTVIATDGNAFTYSHKMSSETIAPGQTLDAMITAPSSIAEDSKFALYDANMLLRNNTGTGTSAGLGGMLTFLNVTGGSSTTGPDVTGPLLTSVTLATSPNTGVPVTLSFTANDTTTGNSNIAAAEYWVDAGAHTPITVSGPASPIKNLTATIPAQSTGTHIVSVRAQDALLNWSATTTINLVVDNVGPTTSGLTLTPNPSNGTVNVQLSFNANDSASGNSNVTAAEYWFDSNPTHTPIAVGSPAPVVTVNATIPAGSGSHTVHVRSQDALGNWGAEAPTPINLVIDNAGPATLTVSAAPNPNNGSLGLSTSVQAVRVTASFSDAAFGGSNLSSAEGFLNVAGTTGTGFAFVANDGIFNSPAESGIADIPLAVVNTLTNGTHAICVHAKDASGNWGAMNCSYNLTIDRTPPTVTSINRVDPNPSPNGSVHFLVTFSEGVTGVTSSNFATVRTGLTGTSTITSVTGGPTAWTVTATTGTGAGTIGLNLTSSANITDLASNALSATLPVVGQVYTITPPPQPSLYFSTTGNTNPSGVSGTADDSDIYLYNGSVFSRNIDLTAAPYSISTSNVDGFDRVDATHFYMSFDGTVTVPGIGSVQDEDVVFYNAGTWSVYFDGTPAARGLSGSDLDAISVVGGILYFSTDDTDVPTGVSGGGDDADIYSWNGTSFARVVDASIVGWSTTNVDGLVWVDATHVYLSYSSDTTAPGSLSVQDEDVVRNNGGTWSTYFDGTGLGLTNTNHDIDAFDLP